MERIHNILIFDTETTGLPKNKFGEIEDSQNWPHIVQLAWVVCEKRGTYRTGQKLKKVQTNNVIIRPDNWRIPKESSDIHGISEARAQQEGMPLMDVIWSIRKTIETFSIDVICCHNTSFDINIILAEESRMGYDWRVSPFNTIPKMCTMELGRNIVKKPFVERHPMSRQRQKAPKLSELQEYLQKEEQKEGKQHDASVDCEVTMLVLEKMINDQLLEKRSLRPIEIM